MAEQKLGADAFLRDALDLVASYLFGQTATLEVTAVGRTDTVPAVVDETTAFLRELEGRHSIACALRLREGVLRLVEDHPSSHSILVDQESRGGIRGRLDLQQYIARRAMRTPLPRTYPVVITAESPQTPENMLVVRCLRDLTTQLGRAPYPRDTAEGAASSQLYAYLRARLRRLPWAEVTRNEAISRLRGVVEQRIRKRQTGNEVGYRALMEWLAEWQADPRTLGAVGDRLARGLLAFPQGDAFMERVFEVWCLREVAQTLVRCGCTLQAGPRSLAEHKGTPVYQMAYDHQEKVEVWFQTMKPVGAPRWAYQSTDRDLRGIPDIVVTAKARVPLVVDAKFRAMRGETRPEETYKLLGYVENFRNTLGRGAFHGVLVFVRPEPGNAAPITERALVGPQDSRITLLAVDHHLRQRAQIEQSFEQLIRDWLATAPPPSLPPNVQQLRLQA